MKKLKKSTALLLLLVGISFVCMTCEKEEPKPKEPDITYYDVIGEGYVFAYDITGNLLYPLEGVEITVLTSREGRTSNFLDPDPHELFFSDSIGKYQVRFIKRYKGVDASRYRLFARYYSDHWSGIFPLAVDVVKNAQHTLELDTFKVYINQY